MWYCLISGIYIAEVDAQPAQPLQLVANVSIVAYGGSSWLIVGFHFQHYCEQYKHTKLSIALIVNIPDQDTQYQVSCFTITTASLL